MPISWEDFEKIDMRAGTILHAQPLPGAKKPAFRLEIDFGAEIGMLQSSAQLTVHYKPEELTGKQVIAVVNFPPKRIAGFISQCLVLGLYDDHHDVVLLQPERNISNGSKVG